MAEPDAGVSLPIVVGLGDVDPGRVTDVLEGHAIFVNDYSDDELAAAVGAIARADVDIDEAFFERAPALRVVARTGVGVDRVDLSAALSRGIPIVITPGAGTHAVAEGAFAMALHLVKRLTPLTQLVREGRWGGRQDVTVKDLDGATIGIVGYGRIGQRVGELARAFDMRVRAYDPVSPPPDEISCTDLSALAEVSDVLTLHVPLTDETYHLIDEKVLARMPSGAILINCGRGGLLDLDAALAALEQGRLAGVGLDVFEPEPPQRHALFDRPDVVLTPHVMGLTERAFAAIFTDAAQGVVDVLEGRDPAAVANPDWDAEGETP
ncbi:MAG: NAD(P)-dependent oxidoreductase [Egibacteraceae bacterium]